MLDESYGDDGVVIVGFPGVAAQANAVLVEPDGKAGLAGGAVQGSPDVLLARLQRMVCSTRNSVRMGG